MAKNAATEGQLGALHARVAQVLTGALDVMDKAQQNYLEAGPDSELPPPEVNASLMSVMTKFLADNKITCVPEESESLSGLEARLAQKQRRKRVGNVVHLNNDDE